VTLATSRWWPLATRQRHARGLINAASTTHQLPATMTGGVIRETGDAGVISIESELPVPDLADGQCLVKNQYAGLNFIDTYHRSGLYARDLPFVGGQEGAGIIVATTPKAEAKGLREGDRVAYNSFFSYAEYTAVPGAKLLPVPDAVPLDIATALVSLVLYTRLGGAVSAAWLIRTLFTPHPRWCRA